MANLPLLKSPWKSPMFIPPFSSTRFFLTVEQRVEKTGRYVPGGSKVSAQTIPCWPSRAEVGGRALPRSGTLSHMLHVEYIYLQNWVIYGVNVGKYSIDGAYGIVITMKRNIAIEIVDLAMNSMVILHSYNGYDSIWIQSFTEIQSLIKLKHWGRRWENNLVGGDWNHGILWLSIY